MKLFRTTLTSFTAGLFLIVASLSGQTTSGTTTGEVFEGFWKATFPESDQTVCLIVKDDNIASYFFDFTQDNLVHPATWKYNPAPDNRLYITGTQGHSFEIARGTDAYTVYWNRDNGSRATGTIISIPKSEVGKWAVPPEEARRRDTTLAEAQGFFGTWEIQTEGALPYYIVVEDDRTAASSYPFSSYGTRGLRGRWVKRGDELHIMWDSGHYSVLRELPNKYESVFYQPDEALSASDSGSLTITTRVDFRAPGLWASEYRDSKIDYPTSISVFRKRSNTRSFYRGKWDVVDAEGNVKETINFGRFQDIDSNREGGIDGSWRVSADWAYITWKDSLRAVVQPIDNAFAISIFLPEQSLDGLPYKYFSIIPHDNDKIAEYIELRGEAAQRLRDYLADEQRNAQRRREREGGWFNFWPFN